MSALAAPWVERVAERSEVVQRSRAREVDHARTIIAAARRLITDRGDQFTARDLVTEAGVTLQTFYRVFGGKDQLILAVFEEVIAENCARYEAAAADLPDPISRLHFYIAVTVGLVEPPHSVWPRFVTAEHWRLHQLFPDEMARAVSPFTDLIARQVELANQEGLLDSADPQRDAWLITKLAMSVFHHYAYADVQEPTAIVQHLWTFCARALGVSPTSET